MGLTQQILQEDGSMKEAWILTFASSLVCILGASVVFLDVFLGRYFSTTSSHIVESKGFLAGSLSLSSGVMLFSSLVVLWPESLSNFSNTTYFGRRPILFVTLSYFIGVALMLTVNAVVRHFSSERITDCGCHDGCFDVQCEPEACNPEETSESGDDNENTKLLHPSKNYPSHPRRHRDYRNTHHYSNSQIPPQPHNITNKCPPHILNNLYGSTPSSSISNLSISPPRHSLHSHPQPVNPTILSIPTPDMEDSHVHHNHQQKDTHVLHHQSMVSHKKAEHNLRNRTRYLTISLQTSLALCLHKFPEGLITFLSTTASPKLGFSLFLAISLHNLTEGMMIALPLYVATGRRLWAFLWAAVGGGGSQPIGALVGFAIVKIFGSVVDSTNGWREAAMGVMFGGVAGMMSVVVVSGLLPQAIRSDPSGKTVTMWFFLGVSIAAISQVLMENA